MRSPILALCLVSLARSGSVQPAGSKLPLDAGWPRQYTDGTAKLVLHQPQIDAWPGFKKLTARFAFALSISRNAQPVWGVLSIEAGTHVNSESQTVTFSGFKVTGMNFPGAKSEQEAKAWEAAVTRLLPAYPTTVAIERILGYMHATQFKVRETAVVLDPPPILVSKQPALLVMIDGEPILVDIEKTNLQKVVNTNWDLFYDKKEGRYFLRDGKVWLSAKALKDAWIPAAKLPKDFTSLPATDVYKNVVQAAPKPQKHATMKLVLVVSKPTELIVIDGEPRLQPIPGTSLRLVTNTECDLFQDSGSGQYYFLTSGRWFTSPELKSGAWTPATTSLPPDFKKIPPSHPRAYVLRAVPGTQDAEEGIVSASMPETATISRKAVPGDVKYIGDPKFEPIPGASVSYATNTPNDVLRLDDSYYLCLLGVWFRSASANGPWEPADKIPGEIYTIPPSSPKYHVTYATVNKSTPDMVTYEYTAGYIGVYIANGVAMWGTGYSYPSFYAAGSPPVYWPNPYYTYGANTWFNPAIGTYVRGSAVYGPYGGYARAAAYNPATGTYTWGRTAWGSYGATAYGGFYNSAAGTWAANFHASGVYQSWSSSVVEPADQDMAPAGRAARKPATRAGHKSANLHASGDYYAGTDGNVYKRDQSGQWYRNNEGSWEPVTPAATVPSQDANAVSFHDARPAAGTAGESIQGGLNHDALARDWGNSHAQWDDSARKSSGWSTSSWVNQGSTGWQARFSW